MSERGAVGAWSYFWRFEKELSFSKGDLISLADAEVLGVEVGREPTMAPGDDILIVLSKGESAIEAQFALGDDGVSETQWLHPDGSLSDAPCA